MLQFRNKTEENSNLIASTISSKSFIDYNSNFGRKGVATLITQTPEIIPIWLVVNKQVLSVFDINDHSKIIRLYRISNLNVKDFYFGSCFQISLKSDEKRKQAQVKQTNEFFSKKKPVDVYKEMEDLGIIKTYNDLYCFLNKKEKDIWLNSIRNHQFE